MTAETSASFHNWLLYTQSETESGARWAVYVIQPSAERQTSMQVHIQFFSFPFASCSIDDLLKRPQPACNQQRGNWCLSAHTQTHACAHTYSYYIRSRARIQYTQRKSERRRRIQRRREDKDKTDQNMNEANDEQRTANDEEAHTLGRREEIISEWMNSKGSSTHKYKNGMCMCSGSRTRSTFQSFSVVFRSIFPSSFFVSFYLQITMHTQFTIFPHTREKAKEVRRGDVLCIHHTTVACTTT